jgi:hypothetical protein
MSIYDHLASVGAFVMGEGQVARGEDE